MTDILRNAALQQAEKPVQHYGAGSRRALLILERWPPHGNTGTIFAPGAFEEWKALAMCRLTENALRLCGAEPFCKAAVARTCSCCRSCPSGRWLRRRRHQGAGLAAFAIWPGRHPAAALLRILGRRQLRFGPDQLQLVIVVYRNPCGTSGVDSADPGRRRLCCETLTMGPREDEGRADAGYRFRLVFSLSAFDQKIGTCFKYGAQTLKSTSRALHSAMQHIQCSWPAGPVTVMPMCLAPVSPSTL